jgi:hypothetical protein
VAYPLSYKRRKKVHTYLDETDFSNELIFQVTKKVRSSGMKLSAPVKDTIRFDGSMFRFIWNGFHFLNGVSKGYFSVEHNEKNILSVKYKLHFTEYFLLALAFSVIPLSTLYVSTDLSIILFAVVWIVFFTGSYIYSIVRFNRFIKKKIKQTEKFLKNKKTD